MRRINGILSASLVVITSALPSAAAFGQDSDVELLKEQIKALEQQLEALKEQVESNSEKTDQHAKQLPPPPPGKKAPFAVTAGGDKVQLAISGQLNRALLFAHDGDEGDLYHVDNDASGTRIRFQGRIKANDKLTAGTNIEVEFQSNPSNAVNQNAEQDVGANNFGERILEVFLDTEYGKISLGQGDTTSNGTSEVDLSGTALGGFSDIATFAGGILWQEDGVLSTTDIGDVLSNLDGLSREDRLRYDSPKYGGVTVGGSAIADDRYDIAARYETGKGGPNQIKAAASYVIDPDFNRLSGSVSALLGGGINGTLAGGFDDLDNGGGRDPWFAYAKLGYKFKIFKDVGGSAVSADYYFGEDHDQEGDEAQSAGIQFVQKADAIATEFFIGGRWHKLDRNAANFDDIFALMTGARLKF